MEAAALFHRYTVVRENWLTRRLKSHAVMLSAWITLALITGSFIYWNDTFGWSAQMSASLGEVYGAGQWWRAWTTLFVHADLRHLISNSFLFFTVGIFLIGYFGTWVFPVAGFFAGGLVNLLVLPGMPANVKLIGASGVVYWMGGFWLTLYLLLDRRFSITQRLLRSLGVAVLLFMPTEAFDPTISYLSHVWGFILGVTFALLYFLFNRTTLQAAEVREVIVEEA